MYAGVSEDCLRTNFVKAEKLCCEVQKVFLRLKRTNSPSLCSHWSFPPVCGRGGRVLSQRLSLATRKRQRAVSSQAHSGEWRHWLEVAGTPFFIWTDLKTRPENALTLGNPDGQCLSPGLISHYPLYPAPKTQNQGLIREIRNIGMHNSFFSHILHPIRHTLMDKLVEIVFKEVFFCLLRKGSNRRE